MIRDNIGYLIGRKEALRRSAGRTAAVNNTVPSGLLGSLAPVMGDRGDVRR
jgi:hypothetical protein